jgi:hypothetical protein
MLCIWEEMFRALCELEELPRVAGEGESASLLVEFNCRANTACKVLTRMVRLYATSAPTMRRLYRRENVVVNGKLGLEIFPKFEACRSVGEVQAMSILECFAIDTEAAIDYRQSYHMLDHLDMLIRKDETVRALLSPKLATLITQLSLASECAYQYSLWADTPSSIGINLNEEHKHLHDFQSWLNTIDDCHFPVHLINPTRGKLRYPVHKAHN